MAKIKAIFEALDQYERYSKSEMISRSREYYADIKRRRTVRDFSSEPVPREIIELGRKFFESASTRTVVINGQNEPGTRGYRRILSIVSTQYFLDPNFPN